MAGSKDKSQHWQSCTLRHKEAQCSDHVYDDNKDINCTTCNYKRIAICTITFDLDNGSVTPFIIVKIVNRKLQILPIPSHSRNYRFDGILTTDFDKETLKKAGIQLWARPESGNL